jgi:hypothetical protein
MPILSPAICWLPVHPSHTRNRQFAIATMENGALRSDRQTGDSPSLTTDAALTSDSIRFALQR